MYHMMNNNHNYYYNIANSNITSLIGWVPSTLPLPNSELSHA